MVLSRPGICGARVGADGTLFSPYAHPHGHGGSMRKRRVREACTVCGRSQGTVLTPFRGIALLCPLHGDVVRGIIPAPTTATELRALFPARVTETRRTRSSAA